MKKLAEDKTKIGRPKLNIDGEKISKWISYGATIKEIADVESCSEDHIHKVFRHNITKGKAQRNIRLRKAQFELALSGNCTMLIWLGKQYLNQREQPSELDSKPMPMGIEIREYTPYELEMLGSKQAEQFKEWRKIQDEIDEVVDV